MNRIASTLGLISLLGCRDEASAPAPISEVDEVDIEVKASLDLLRRASDNPCEPGLTVKGEPHNYTVTEDARCSVPGATNGFKYNGDCGSTYLCLELMPIRVCPHEETQIQQIFSLGGFTPTHQDEIRTMITEMDAMEGKIKAGHLRKAANAPLECPK